MTERQCLREGGAGKVVYLTKQDAKRAIRDRPGDSRTGWNAWYKCSQCGYYHTGRKV